MGLGGMKWLVNTVCTRGDVAGLLKDSLFSYSVIFQTFVGYLLCLSTVSGLWGHSSDRTDVMLILVGLPVLGIPEETSSVTRMAASFSPRMPSCRLPAVFDKEAEKF